MTLPAKSSSESVFAGSIRLGSGQPAWAATAFGRVVEDVGLAAGRDELEGAALGYGVVTGGASGERDQRRTRDDDPPPHCPASSE